MPMGPLALYDMVGIDTSLYAGRVMWEAFPDRIIASPILPAMVKAGRWARRPGAAFSSIKDKKGTGRARSDAGRRGLARYCRGERKFTPEELIARLFLPMVLEATRILEAKLVRDVRDVDLGLIFGTGFPAVPRRAAVLGRYAGRGQDRRAAQAVRVAGRAAAAHADAAGNGRQRQASSTIRSNRKRR